MPELDWCNDCNGSGRIVCTTCKGKCKCMYPTAEEGKTELARLSKKIKILEARLKGLNDVKRTV